METLSIKDIFTRKPEQDIIRFSYTPYSLEFAVSVFKKIGEHIAGSFVIDDENKFVIENLIRWAHADSDLEALNPDSKEIIKGDPTKGIYIAGNTGTGKSLLFQMLAMYLTIDNVRALFLGSQKMLTYSCFTTNRVCSYYAENGNINPFIDSPVICFQDLGTSSEQKETLFMGTRTKVMQTIIQERGDTRGLITLFSSNNGIVDPDTEKLYDDRGVSRLRKMCNYYELIGKDRRN